MLNDAKLAGHPGRVEFTRLRVPLLLLSAVDDRFETAPPAQAIARQVPRARLVLYPSGGHILVGHTSRIRRPRRSASFAPIANRGDPLDR